MAELLDDGRNWDRRRWKTSLKYYSDSVDGIKNAVDSGEYDSRMQYVAETTLYEMRIFYPSAQRHCSANIPDWKTNCPCRGFIRLVDSYEDFMAECDRMLSSGYQDSML